MSDDGSLKKYNYRFQIILSLITIILSCLHLAIYRKIVNVNSVSGFDFKTELYIFSWRYQVILLLIITYSMIYNVFKKKETEHNGVASDISLIYSRVHSFQLSIKDIIQFDKIWFIFINLLSSFMFLLSTYFIPLGLAMILYYSSFFYALNLPLYGNYLEGKIKNTTVKIFTHILYLFGIIEVISHSHNFFGVPTNKESISNICSFVCGLILCFFANYLNFQQKIHMNNVFKEKSPFQIVFVIYFNLTVVTLGILAGYIIFFDNCNLYNLFGWLFSIEKFYQVGLGVGLLAFSQIIINILMTIFVETNWIKFLQIIEPLFADMFAIFIVHLYSAPKEPSYYIGILEITVASFFVEFSILFEKFEKNSN